MKLSRWGQLDSSLSVRFVLPVIWENTLTIVVGLLFSRVISGISASALAAIGMSNTVMTVAFAVFSMVTTGASVLVSRHIGAQESREAANTVEQTILLSLVSSSVVTLLCFAAAWFRLPISCATLACFCSFLEKQKTLAPLRGKGLTLMQ